MSSARACETCIHYHAGAMASVCGLSAILLETERNDTPEPMRRLQHRPEKCGPEGRNWVSIHE